MAGMPRHYNRLGSTCQNNYGKLGKGTTSVQHTPPLPPQLGASVGVVWVWVGGFQKFWPIRTLEAKWRDNKYFLIHVWVPLLKQMKGHHPGLPNTNGFYICFRNTQQ